MRDSFGLPIRSEILSGALTLPVAALDALLEPHSRRTAGAAGLPRRIVAEGDADPPDAQFGHDWTST